MANIMGFACQLKLNFATYLDFNSCLDYRLFIFRD